MAPGRRRAPPPRGRGEPDTRVGAGLEAARPGARLPEIAAAVATPAPAQPRELDYVRTLVQAQILVADLQLQVTGATPLDALIADLEQVGGADTSVGLLRGVRDAMHRLDNDGGVPNPANYSDIADLLAQIRVAPAPEQPCHVVLSLPPGGRSLARTTVGDIERGARLLARIAPVRSLDELAKFKVAFVERYGRREVPLAEALDDQLGVGFGATRPDRATLLDGLVRTMGPRRSRRSRDATRRCSNWFCAPPGLEAARWISSLTTSRRSRPSRPVRFPPRSIRLSASQTRRTDRGPCSSRVRGPPGPGSSAASPRRSAASRAGSGLPAG